MMGPTGRSSEIDNLFALIALLKDRKALGKRLDSYVKERKEHGRILKLSGGLKAAEKIIASADEKQRTALNIVFAAKLQGEEIIQTAKAAAKEIGRAAKARERSLADAEADIKRRVAAVAKLQTDAQTTNDAALVRLEAATEKAKKAGSHEAEMKRKLAAVTAAAA